MIATQGTWTSGLTTLQRLKIELMAEGMSVSPEARRALSGSDGLRPLTLAEYASTSGVILVLGDDIWVNVPIADHNANFVTAPAYTLDHRDDGFFLSGHDTEFPVKPVPVPSYHNERLPNGRLITDFAVTHTDRVRISPIQGCSYVCTFCDLPYDKRYEKMPIEGLIQSVRRALEDPILPARHILISGGVPRDEDWPWLNEVYETVVATFPDVPVDVMMVPVPGHFSVERLYEMGIHALFLNLEIYNEGIARKIMPHKVRIGQQAFLDVIEKAANLFGPGRIYSLLLVGIEPSAETLKGVAALAERGCGPVLSPFRPDLGTPLRNQTSPTANTIQEVFLQSAELVVRECLELGPQCIQCMHNTLTFPKQSSYIAQPHMAICP